MPPTFASAAASGSNPNSTRAEGASEWTRRANGSTQTFRRTSQATTTATPNSNARENNANQRNSSERNSSEIAAPYIPPHMNANRNGTSSVNGGGGDFRYSKEKFLEVFRAEKDAGSLLEGVDGLLIGGFQPSESNGVASATWGRREEPKDNHSVDLCWDRNARMYPLGLQEFTDEETDLFNGSVNSPIKPPTLANKDGTPAAGGSARKTSISQALNSPGPYGLTSPTQTRPGNRRRDTSEAYPFPETSLTSPSTSRFSRGESAAATPPAALLRRRTEQKESISEDVDERDKEKDDAAPTGGLKRAATAGLGVTTPSTWGASTTTGFGPMGSFGNFALGASSTPQSATEKRGGYGSMRGQSRFAGMMKDSSADPGGDLRSKVSLSNLQQSEPEQGGSWMDQRQQQHYGANSDPYAEDDMTTGSAALGGGRDESPPKPRGYAPYGSSRVPEDGGLSMLGMTTDNVGGHNDFSHHQTPQHNYQRNDHSHEQMSPTNTNPYQSPENERTEPEDYAHESHDMQSSGHLPGLGGFRGQPGHGLPGLGTQFPGFGGRIPHQHEIAASDRSQTSSTGPNRAFPGLSGLGGLPGLGGASPWSGHQQGIGTPTRERAGFGGAFGDGQFGSGADMQSPALAGLGGAGPFSAGGFGGGRSKMGSLFPSAMQEQMRMGDGGPGPSEEQSFDPFARQHAGISGLSRGPIGSSVLGSAGPARQTESPFRNTQQMFDDLLEQTPRNEMPSAIGESSGMYSQLQGGNQTPISAGPGQDPLGLARKSYSNLQRQASVSSQSTSQPPLQQMRQMVMPDRMRWIYKDPQGSTQGPWSGLEMHDWYRAGFFTPELLIKRVEDPEFEPLAQLIRRIGNSREPFLVPQIGVPHDASAAGSKPPNPAGVQPPFPNSFPSFGTTLTAEQQNALERRKQEEQFLMARQKEHLAQQQVYIKQQMGHGSGMMGGQLHHHSSAHSLHSQPSFGSVTSPATYQPSPTQGPLQGGPNIPGFFDNAFRGPHGGQPGADVLGSIRESDVPGMMERLNLNNSRGQQGQQYPLGHGLPDDMQSAQIAAMLQDRARLQREQAEHDQHRRESGQSFEEQEALDAQSRYQQFQDLRAQEQEMEEEEQRERYEQHSREMSRDEPQEETLTQQVQAASAAKQASAQAQQSPWAKMDPVHAERIQHPGQSASPMPAPIAQRKHNVADHLAEETRSGTQSPAVETPTTTLAPWANHTTEVPKTLSLKEIQEAEAKRAAKQEEFAAAQRRAAFEREMAAAQAAQNIQPAPGLPTGATWASQSPATPSASGPAPWGTTKPTTKASGKTLQQIQREEEAKKHRAAQAAASNIAVSAAPVVALGGKRYADLAGKSASPAGINAPPGSWTTVGASGKVKAIPSPTNASPARSVSGVVPTVGKPAPASRSTTMGSAQMQKFTKADALGEFKKWAVSELQRGGLHPSISPPDFIETLLVIGSEIDILTEAVHGSCQTIDSRHFAEEFVRRKKQADKGIVIETTASPVTAKANENAWSNVAKKSGGALASPTVAASSPASGEFKVAKAKGRRKQ